MTDYHAKTINLVANGLGGWRLWTADDADDPAVVAVPYILAAEHERLREALTMLVEAHDRESFMRSADFHRDGCRCLRCAFDRARAALGDDNG